MDKTKFRIIDPQKTGQNIKRLMSEKEVDVTDLQKFFNFAAPQAIYKWLSGQSLPSVDNLYALSGFLETPIDNILVSNSKESSELEK